MHTWLHQTILDNLYGHLSVDALPSMRNTTVHYLPPNTTSKLEPCDVGIIRYFNAYYWHRFNLKLLENIKAKRVDSEKIDVLKGILLVVEAWKEDVKPETVANCFRHYKICSLTQDESNVPEMEPESTLINEIGFHIMEFRYPSSMYNRNFIDYPAKQEVGYISMEEYIIEDLVWTNDDNFALEYTPEEADDSIEKPMIKPKERVQAAQTLTLSFIAK